MSQPEDLREVAQQEDLPTLEELTVVARKCHGDVP